MSARRSSRSTAFRGMLGVAAAVVGSVAVAGGALSANAATNPSGTPTGPQAPLAAVTGKTVPGQYIVVLKRGGDGATVARQHGIKTGRVYSKSIAGFSAKLTAAQLTSVRQNPAVAYVAPDGVVTTVDKPVPADPAAKVAPGSRVSSPSSAPVSGKTVQTGATWGLDRVDQKDRPLDGAYHYTATGAGVTAYVIDTGIYAAHSQFGGRAVGGFTTINDGNGTNDCMGHGTHVAGTIGGSTYGVAKAAKLVPVRVLGCTGSGTWSDVLAGIDWVTYTHNGPSVANMSLAGGLNPAINDAVTNSMAQGVTYAVAAANSADDACAYSPAATPGALTVGATDNTDTRASFSNYGTCVDLFAPGVNVTSAWIGGNTAVNTISGTSMASPHVAGLAALYLQANPSATPAVVQLCPDEGRRQRRRHQPRRWLAEPAGQEVERDDVRFRGDLLPAGRRVVDPSCSRLHPGLARGDRNDRRGPVPTVLERHHVGERGSVEHHLQQRAIGVQGGRW